MIYICSYCGGMFDHAPIPLTTRSPCPFCHRETYEVTDRRTRRCEEKTALREATKKERDYFKSSDYCPPEVYHEDEWGMDDDFCDDLQPFGEEDAVAVRIDGLDSPEVDQDLLEPLHAVKFSDEYEQDSLALEETESFQWVDTDSQVFIPKTRKGKTNRKAS